MKLAGWILLLGVFLSGCASGPNANPADPLEPMNRSIYKFNDVLDKNVLKPVASTYRDVTPSFVQRGISNFFANLEDLWSAVNNALQLKGERATESAFRVTINTIVGIGGVFDVASEIGLERRTEDFGQTLGYWGMGPGPYIVLPILGPSNLRDGAGLIADYKADPVTRVDDIAVRNTLIVTRAVDQRSHYLKADDLLEEVALDKYTFMRDGYLQRRRNLVYDGNPPDEEPVDEAKPVETAPK